MPDADFDFWSRHTVPVLSALLKSSGSYTTVEQETQLAFFKSQVLPTFGPKPEQKDAQYLFMTHNGSPIEFSINLSDVKPPQVRFSFTPVGEIDTVAGAVGADLTWFRQLATQYFPSTDVAAKAKAVLPPNIPRIPDCLAALDLDGGKRAMKAYFGPMIKAVGTGVIDNEGAMRSIKNLQPGGEGMAGSLGMIQSFAQSNPEIPFVIAMIGIDCIAPAAARVKMYTRIGSNGFDVVRKLVTLGGQRSDPITLKGLEILREIWPLLLNEPDDAYDEEVSKPEFDPKAMHAGIMITWELQASKNVPKAKVYVPLFQFCNNNQLITANMERVFSKLGWVWGGEGGYTEAIQSAL